nr:hypothetical protein [Tanacetum cinerariifolium]
MSAISDVKCVLTQKALDAFCNKFYILEEVHHILPNQNDTMHERPAGKIGLYTRFFDFANFRLPLSTFLVDVLRHFRINISQLSVIGAAKVSHFEILCRVNGIIPTIGLFRCFYVNSKKSGWMSFSKRSDNAFVCYTKPLDSLKNSNGHFFWVNEFACPASFSWHTAKHVTRDPAPVAADFNAQDYATLVAHPSPTEMVEMDIFAFIHTPNPTKVRIVERERNEEVSVKRLFDEGGSGNQTEQGDSAGGEPNTNIQPVVEAVDITVENRLLAGVVLNAKVRVAAIPTLPFVTNSVSTMPEREGGDHVDSVTEPNLRTIGAPQRFFISSDSSHHSGTNVAEAEVDSLIKSSVLIMRTATTINSTDDPTSVAKEKLVKPSPFSADSSSADGTDPTTCVFSDLTGSDFLVGAIRTVREEEIESLKARLLLREAKATKAICLCAEASNFKSVEKSLRDETNALRERNVILEKEQNALDVKVKELETSAMSKECELTNLNAMVTSVKLYADFVEMALHLEEKFYPHLFTTISGRMWLLTHGIELAIANCLNSLEYLFALEAAIGKATEKGMQDGLAAGITHGKEGRVLTDVVAYNPSAELQNVNFSLLARLKSNKDASVETMMDIIGLEGPLAKKLRLNELQPYVD